MCSAVTTFELKGERYQAERMLAKGTFGRVYKVKAFTSGQYYAFKAIKQSFKPTEIAQLASSESSLLGRIFEGIEVVDKVSLYGKIYTAIKMPYLGPRNLKQAQKAELGSEPHKWTSEHKLKAFGWVAQMMREVSHIHSAEIVHADIKLSQFILSESDIVRLIDFSNGYSFDKKPPSHIRQGAHLYLDFDGQFNQTCEEKHDIRATYTHSVKSDYHALGRLVLELYGFNWQSFTEYMRNKIKECSLYQLATLRERLRAELSENVAAFMQDAFLKALPDALRGDSTHIGAISAFISTLCSSDIRQVPSCSTFTQIAEYFGHLDSALKEPGSGEAISLVSIPSIYTDAIGLIKTSCELPKLRLDPRAPAFQPGVYRVASIIGEVPSEPKIRLASYPYSYVFNPF